MISNIAEDVVTSPEYYNTFTKIKDTKGNFQNVKFMKSLKASEYILYSSLKPPSFIMNPILPSNDKNQDQ